MTPVSYITTNLVALVKLGATKCPKMGANGHFPDPNGFAFAFQKMPSNGYRRDGSKRDEFDSQAGQAAGVDLPMGVEPGLIKHPVTLHPRRGILYGLIGVRR
jgi:hypothetical protein